MKKITKKPKDKAELRIVKKEGHSELYDERKVYGSCYFACRNSHLSEQESEEICNKVCMAINELANSKKIMSSDDIFMALIEELKKYNEDAAFLYETHRDLS